MIFCPSRQWSAVRIGSASFQLLFVPRSISVYFYRRVIHLSKFGVVIVVATWQSKVAVTVHFRTAEDGPM